MSASGSFLYDSDTPLTNITNGPVVFNQANYENSISGFSGSVGAFSFETAERYLEARDIDGIVGATLSTHGLVQPDPLRIMTYRRAIDAFGVACVKARSAR